MSRIATDSAKGLKLIEDAMNGTLDEPTPGNWKPDKRGPCDMPPEAVVSDSRCDHLFPCCPKLHAGHVIASHITNPADVPLIAAAKELLALVRDVSDYFHDFTEVDTQERAMARRCRSVIAKVKEL